MEKYAGGQLKRKLFLFSLPIIGSLFVQQLYGVVDMVLIGRYLGAAELAAVGNATNIVMIFIVISGGIELAVELIISRYIGKSDAKSVAEACTNLLVFGLLVGMAVALIGFLNTAALLRLIRLPVGLMSFAGAYAKIYILGLPFIYMFDISRAMLLSLGSSRKSFYLMLSATVLNLLLNLLFITVLQLGVAGSALGTVLAQAICMLFSLQALHREMKKNPYFTLRPSFKPEHFQEMLQIALPTIFQQFAVTFSSVILQSLVNPFGNEIIIGFVAINKVMMVSRIVIIGLAQTLTIFSAQLFSGKKYRQMQTAQSFLLTTALGYALLTGVIFWLIPDLLGDLFFDTATHKAAFAFFAAYLNSYFFIQLLSVFKFMNESALRSTLRMKEYLICNVGDLAVKISLTYVLIDFASTQAFWMGELIARIFVFLLSTFYIRRFKSTLTGGACAVE